MKFVTPAAGAYPVNPCERSPEVTLDYT